MTRLLTIWAAVIGWEPNKTGHLDKWLSALGGLAGVLAVVAISQHFVDPQGTAGILASVGASAVLLFAVPHGALSQPWPLVGGHVISAMVGVVCATWISELAISAPVAVAVAIGAMYYLRCIHPPGGATALTAVVGGDSVHALGFQYVVTPVLLNALVILAIAVVFNALFAWRRYPVALANLTSVKKAQSHPVKADEEALSRGELKTALQAMSRADDDTDLDLQELYHLVKIQSEATAMAVSEIQAGHCYSNGLHGPLWQIRRVAAIRRNASSDVVEVAYRVVAGADRRECGTNDVETFARWARYEVFLNESSWQRVDCAESPSCSRS